MDTGTSPLEMDVRAVVVTQLEAIIHRVTHIRASASVSQVLQVKNVTNVSHTSMDSLQKVASNVIVTQVDLKASNAMKMGSVPVMTTLRGVDVIAARKINMTVIKAVLIVLTATIWSKMPSMNTEPSWRL